MTENGTFDAKNTDQADAVHAGTILIIEGRSDVRDLLESGLTAEGYEVVTAAEGAAALKLIERSAIQPSLVISDFDLPNGMDGLCVSDKLRANLRRPVPVIILTGDISTRTLRDIATHKCEHLNKPARLKELVDMIERLVPASGSSGGSLASPADTASVFIVDDDVQVRLAIRSVLEEDGRLVEDYEDGESFFDAYRPGCNACLLIDVNLPGMSGLELLKRLKDAGHPVPVIMMTGHSDVPMAVEAMKAGASDFLEKPVRCGELLAGVRHALESSRDTGKLMKCRKEAADHLAGLTQRQHQIMDMVLAGHPSKIIAADLRISQRTVENHRASIMKKAGVRSLPALARLALAAAGVLVTDQSLATMSEVLSS